MSRSTLRSQELRAAVPAWAAYDVMKEQAADLDPKPLQYRALMVEACAFAETLAEGLVENMALLTDVNPDVPEALGAMQRFLMDKSGDPSCAAMEHAAYVLGVAVGRRLAGGAR
jgi:hypothetical protein